MWDIKREGGSERDQTEGLNFRIPSNPVILFNRGKAEKKKT